MPKVTHCSLKPLDTIRRTSCLFQSTLREKEWIHQERRVALRWASQRRAHPQATEGRGKAGKGRREGSRGWRKFGGSACCGIYIPCLATISIGQDRKYTIEGSSATDKDYPIENKTKQKKTADGLFNI